MAKGNPERVLLLAAEGGAVEFFRHELPDGRYHYTKKPMGCGFDRSDFDDSWTPPVEEHSDSQTVAIFETLEEAITSEFSDGLWVHLAPEEIHPEYRLQLWRRRQNLIQARDDRNQDFGQWREYKWAEACGISVPE